MDQPVQNPPVDRQYMRPVVGRKGKPEERATAPQTGKKAQNSEHGPPGGDYLIELTTFHIRPTSRRTPG
jgi:hypothetical protein